MGSVLLFYVGFGQTAGVVVVHSDGYEGRNRGYLGGGEIEKIIFCEFNLDTACMEQGLRNVIGEYFNRIAGPCLED